MTFLGAVDIPTRGVDDFRATLKDREAKLANAKRQRDVILARQTLPLMLATSARGWG